MRPGPFNALRQLPLPLWWTAFDPMADLLVGHKVATHPESLTDLGTTEAFFVIELIKFGVWDLWRLRP